VLKLYQILSQFIYLLVYPWGILKEKQRDQLWSGRMGRLENQKSTDIWLHASSVGEVRVIAHLINYLKDQRPGINLHLTTVTSNGYKTAKEIIGNKVTLSFFPFDTKSVISRTLDTLQPTIIVIAETEIWPNLISVAGSRDIPLILINGRMSASSLKKYRFFAGTLEKLFVNYKKFFLKSDENKKRYSHFGIEDYKLIVAGDMKFDAPLLVKDPAKIRQIRSQLNLNDKSFLYVAGSTRPGEEEQILSVYEALQGSLENLKLLLAPRHIERIDEIISLLKARNLPYYIYGKESASSSVCLVDRMGLLNDFYQAADLAFVGGTLVDLGGHNLLEPVWCQTPVIFGESIHNVSEAADYILDHNYGVQVDSAKKMTEVLKAVISGQLKFSIKTEQELDKSATTQVGKYILGCLKNV